MAIGSVAHRHEGAGIVHHRHSDFDVTDAHAVVDSLAGAALAIPRVDVRRSELELECCRHAVERTEPIDLRRLSVIVQVDEARGDDKVVRVDDIPTAYGFGRDDSDLSIENPDVANRIEIRFRIDNASAEND